MSSSIWTRCAGASEIRPLRRSPWRAVEAQHQVSTRKLVDSLDEQALLEELIDRAKPPHTVREGLHYLLFTPFRYPPPPGGSRFRGPNDPGVFYGADEIRTACAELGYWRWRHLMDSPALATMPTKPQTVFQVKIDGNAVDLRAKPFVRDRKAWTDAGDYSGCQAFGRTAREARIGAIRYESVRDPQHAACCALLAPSAFASPNPLEQQTWMLSVARDRVIWQRTHSLRAEEHEFAAAQWSPSAR